MSKKKSYMDSKNILSEDIISSFLKGLFKGITGIKSKPKKDKKQIEKDLQGSVDRFNDAISRMHAATNKIRKAEGKPPKKRQRKLTTKDIMNDLEKGKL